MKFEKAISNLKKVAIEDLAYEYPANGSYMVVAAIEKYILGINRIPEQKDINKDYLEASVDYNLNRIVVSFYFKGDRFKKTVATFILKNEFYITDQYLDILKECICEVIFAYRRLNNIEKNLEDASNLKMSI